jgi:ABC-type Fe3+/spermidine/putrescine transport system ATPase subunit
MMLRFSKLQIYIYATINTFPLKERTRLIDNVTIMNFQALLKKETWESLYRDPDPNCMYKSFLCTFLNIFQAHFPGKYKCMKDKNDWITQGIKISCKNKRKPVSFPKKSNDP